jgi:hypothetical protein
VHHTIVVGEELGLVGHTIVVGVEEEPVDRVFNIVNTETGNSFFSLLSLNNLIFHRD